MATANKLGIRGVRAFSSEEDEQVLAFSSLPTIIVGRVGFGKTTIVEVLKYAITGALPPGIGSDVAFVHYHECTGQHQVKAVVKLCFTTKEGQEMQVVRNMVVTRGTTGAVKFRQLNGSLGHQDPTTGETFPKAYSVSDLDKHVPHLMGVSKPIVDYVLLCNQEDGMWPLMAKGPDLKERFDAIFGKENNSGSAALLCYRRHKLVDVNKKIRELWPMVYKYGDITNIAVVYDLDTYNYRIVMTKGTGSKLDMRDHCSPTQGFLACIVIRLALAEALGGSCGLIALDEPAQQLDSKLKAAMAKSLVQIVASRRQQSNFQLVLTTRDEEFMNILKAELGSTGFMPENHFELERQAANDGFYSKINKMDWN